MTLALPPPTGTIAATRPEAVPSGLSVAAAVACIVLVGMELRPGIVSIGPLLPQIRAEFGLSNVQSAWLTAIPTLLMGLLAILTPWLARRFGRDHVILAALIVLAIATAARAWAPTAGFLFVTAAGVGAGVAIAGALVAGFVKSSFPAHAAVMMGVYAMALGLGSTLAAALAGPLASLGGGWRLSAGVFVLPALTAVTAWLVVARRHQPRDLIREASPAARVRMPTKNPTAWLAALYFSVNNILFFGLLAWIAPIYRERGFDDTATGLVLASFTAAFMLANPMPGLLGRSEDRRLLIGLFAGIALVGVVGLAALPAVTPFVLVPLAALGIGGSFTLGMTLPLDNASTPDEAVAWNAFVMAIGYGTAAIGPLAVGALRDLTGNFTAALWVLAAVALVKFSLAAFLRPYHSKRSGATASSSRPRP